tara:strand:- start:424 stop:1167 length:744 start_codon:yes stop_codon:yes gene_type:complete
MSEHEQTTQDNEAPTNDAVKSGPVVITATNPSTEEMTALLDDIKINYDFDVSTKATQFNFKKSKDKDTGIETVREPVVLAMPYPSVQGIVAILEAGGKGLELLMDAMEGIVNTQARDLLQEDTAINAATFPVEKVSWDFISKIPKAQRRGGGIPKETWEAFGQDYVEVMPDITGKTVEQIANAAKILVSKLASVKTNEPVLNLLVAQLAVYTENSPNVEEFEECVAFLLQKADTFLNISEEDLLANL